METSTALASRINSGLRKLGYERFRGNQEAAVTAALTGRDCLVLMPTGGGKSLCYALPAAVMGTLTVVISPLIALMQDQARNLQGRGMHAEYMSSSQTSAEQAAILRQLQTGKPALQLLLTTPESFGTDRLLSALKTIYASGNLGLLAIDEAHCISSWGHDFRPAYRRLARLRQEFARTPIMALTATATKEVQDDIVGSLHMNYPLRLISSFNRPNIRYEVVYQLDDSPPLAKQLAKLIQGMCGPDGATPCCIVYTLKRETADEYAQKLRMQGIGAKAYHAGLKDTVRGEVLREWSTGITAVVVATVAFGMGIDRANVRLVAHVNLPKTLEGFYQESGRAGRDGLHAESVLFYDIEDRQRMDYILSKQGGKKRKARSPAGEAAPPEAACAAFGRVVRYATSERCRRAMLLEHFGERRSETCQGCDYCQRPLEVSAQLGQLSAQGPKRLAQQLQRFGARSHLSFGQQQDGDSSEGSEAEVEDLDDGRAEAQAALRAAKRAKKNRSRDDGALFAAMEAAERKHEAKSGSREARLLQKMQGVLPASSAPRKPGSMPIGDAMRVASKARLVQAMQDSPACRHAPNVKQAAEEIEAACFNSSASKTLYISKLAKHVSAAKTCEGVQALLHSAGTAVQGTSAMLSEVRSAGPLNNLVDPDVQHSFSGAEEHNRLSMMPQREGKSHPHRQSESSASGDGRSAHDALTRCHKEVTKLREMLTTAAQKRQRDMMDAGRAYAGPYAELSVGDAMVAEKISLLVHLMNKWCLELNESFAKEQSALQAACSLLCGMKVNCAILKATSAGKHLRGVSKSGILEGHPSILSLIKQVIKSWKHQVIESVGSS